MEKFFIGVDVGTQSVGVACTDENYNILRAKGKDLWAVRLFDKAKDAADRRMKRSARRRFARRKQRIDFLQDIFAPFMEDNLFFIRLNNSGFFEEDKKDLNGENLNTPYSLFADERYNDCNYYSEYKTIYHLRKRLIESDEKFDLRLYYLALHHIIKYRGHFLFDIESENGIENISELFYRLNRIAADELIGDEPLELPIDAAENFAEIAGAKGSLSDKKKEIAARFGFGNKSGQELITLLLGGTAKTAVIFGENYAEAYADEKISFKKMTDEEFEAKNSVFEEGQFAFLQAAKAIYNFVLLKSVLGDEGYVSYAMVKLYEKHKSDLALLKKLMKDCGEESYYKVFRSKTEKFNYANYVGYTKANNRKTKVKKCTPDEFFKFLRGVVKAKCVGEAANYVLSEIDNGTFLPKILNADNGVFPHQLNEVELNAILNNLCKNYPAFAVKAADGFTPAEKIKKLFLFKIPYFVGPLNDKDKDSGNCWIVKKEGRVTPFNYEEMVNEKASNEKFILRMTNKCTYLRGKDVLPKHSIKYEKFTVLNQLNKWKINEQPISVDLKKAIFNDLFLKRRKVTKNSVRVWLVNNGYVSKEEAKEISLSGFDGEIEVSMSSYVVLDEILKGYPENKPDVCENIILWHTLYEDKNYVEERIRENYSDDKYLLSKIKEIKGITSFKKFGKLSKEFLCELEGGVDPVTGEIYTILGELYNTNKNLNEIIYDSRYCFEKSLAEFNSVSDKVNYHSVEELYVSPMVRRGIWQAIQMVDEYVRAVGKQPDKIFVEVARAEGEKKRTVSRKNKLLELYSGLGKDCREYDKVIAQLNDIEPLDLRKEKLYLYFTQLGRCAYTGKRIELEDLSSDLYDVDHILPRSMTKDDSLDNKVLVLREKNAQKADIYPLADGFTDQQKFWAMLHDKKLFSDKKYNLLKRVNPLNEDDLRDFIARQMVVTNQSAKALAELLGRKYKETKIVYSKAKNVSDFRQRYSIVKCRETNDLHHARDAYLNIAVGNVYDVKFSRAQDYFYRKDDFWREYNLNNLFTKNTVGAWDKDKSLNTVLSTINKTSMCVTGYSFIEQGAFYNETLYSGDNKIGAPRKEYAPYTDVKKYGGYINLAKAHFSVVRSTDKKGRRIITVEDVPVLDFYKMGKSAGETDEKLLQYFANRGLVEPELIVAKLKVNSLVKVNGFFARIAGVSDSILLHNAVQWFTDSKTDLYVKNLVKLNDIAIKNGLSEAEQQNDYFNMHTNSKGEVKVRIDGEQNLELYDKILDKLNSDCYGNIRSIKTFISDLSDGRERFISLSVLDQVKALVQIIRFMKCNAEIVNLSLIGASKNTGLIRISKNITDLDFEIINLSPCGLTERKIKIS